MKCHERWIDILACVQTAYPELSSEAENKILLCQQSVSDSIIDFELIEAAFNYLFEKSQDKNFGWNVGWNISLRTQLHRAMAIYSDIQATVWDSFLITQQFPELSVFPGMQYNADIGKEASTLYVQQKNYPFKYPEQIAALCLAANFKISRDRFSDFDLLEITGTNIQNENFSSFSKAKVNFSESEFSFKINSNWLAVPLPTADITLINVLKPVLESETAKLRNRESLIDKIEKALLQSQHPQQFSLKEFSTKIGLSEANIRRKLTELQVSFSELTENFMRNTAVKFLMDERETIDSITYLLGYSERAAFERSFKRWFGLSPSQFREKYRSMSVFEDTVHSSINEIEICALPNTIQDTLNYLNQKDFNLNALVKIIKNDVVLNARLISAANTAFFGAGKVVDLSDAIGRVLGINKVRIITMELALKDTFKKLPPDFDFKKIWFVSMVTEIWLGKISRKHVWDSEIAISPFSIAIQFSLIGQYLIASSDLPNKGNWLEKIKESSLLDIVEWENANLNMNVFTITALILTRWGMNTSICRILLNISANISFEKMETMQQSTQIALLICDIAYASYTSRTFDPEKISQLAGVLGANENMLADTLTDTLTNHEDLMGLL